MYATSRACRARGLWRTTPTPGQTTNGQHYTAADRRPTNQVSAWQAGREVAGHARHARFVTDINCENFRITSRACRRGSSQGCHEDATGNYKGTVCNFRCDSVTIYRYLFSELAFGKLRIAIKYYGFNLLRSTLFRVGGAHKSELSMRWVNSWVGLGCIGIPDFFL